MVESNNYLQIAKNVETHEKPGFHGFPWFSMISHDFGEKCSKIAGKVVAAGGRDQKSTVRAHLVAEKLSVTSYFCLQTCSEPDWSPIFPG
jgi:hypothetical protein